MRAGNPGTLADPGRVPIGGARAGAGAGETAAGALPKGLVLADPLPPTPLLREDVVAAGPPGASGKRTPLAGVPATTEAAPGRGGGPRVGREGRAGKALPVLPALLLGAEGAGAGAMGCIGGKTAGAVACGPLLGLSNGLPAFLTPCVPPTVDDWSGVGEGAAARGDGEMPSESDDDDDEEAEGGTAVEGRGFSSSPASEAGTAGGMAGTCLSFSCLTQCRTSANCPECSAAAVGSSNPTPAAAPPSGEAAAAEEAEAAAAEVAMVPHMCLSTSGARPDRPSSTAASDSRTVPWWGRERCREGKMFSKSWKMTARNARSEGGHEDDEDAAD